MNCPSRVDSVALPNGWNQNPNVLASDTNAESNDIVNLRQLHSAFQPGLLTGSNPGKRDRQFPTEDNQVYNNESKVQTHAHAIRRRDIELSANPENHEGQQKRRYIDMGRVYSSFTNRVLLMRQIIWKFLKFVGPGFMVAVAYIDPGNYATDASAGATYRYQLLVMVLASNIIAVYLQTLCVKLGTVTGLNLAESIKENCPPWMNYFLYFFAEAAIIATDIAEVIGTAIALNLLINVPLVAGCALSIFDVLVLLLFYRPSSGSVIAVRAFELFVIALVLGVTICFSVELSLLHIPDIGMIFRGYMPSSALVQSQGLVQACGILGATVMPHSLYLGSGIVQPRLRNFDKANGNINAPDGDESVRYRPSIAAIRSCLSYSIAELVTSLFTIALFVNSAILIVCGASLYGVPGSETATLFEIHDLLSHTLAPVASTVFALGLLFSGTSAGIVCTIAGQIVSEGQLNWSVKPWVRRLVTRSISIAPSIIIAGAVGERGVTAALQGTQVALSIILPFTSAPLIWFTCQKKIMMVPDSSTPGGVNMQNNVITAVFGALIWLLIVVLNVALIVLTGLGQN